MNALLRHGPASVAVLAIAMLAWGLVAPRAEAQTCDPSYFPAADQVYFRSAQAQTSRFSQASTFWAGFAVMTTDNTTDYDLFMYTSCAGGYLAGSNSALGRTDFVLGDFNYNPTLADNAVDIPCYSGSCGYATGGAVTWRSGGFLFVDFPPTSVAFTTGGPPYNPDLIMHVWDVYLAAGTRYFFQFSSTLGTGMKLLLFRNKNQGTYWVGRDGAEFEVTGCTSYTAPASGYYGLVVVNDVWASGSYTVGVTTQPTCACAQSLPEATPVAVPASPTTSYSWSHPEAGTGWVALGERPEAGSDWDFEASSAGSPPGCGQSVLSNSSLAGSAADFVAVDFSRVQQPSDIACRTSWFSGGGGAHVEWNGTASGPDNLWPNGPEVDQAWGANDVLHCWTAHLDQNVGYTFQFVASPNMKLFLFENPGNGLYAAGRVGATLQAVSTFTYTPPATGNYGVVVVKDDDQAGYVSLRVGTCEDPYALSPGVTLLASPYEHWYTIQATGSRWQALGTRGAYGSDWDLTQYGSMASAAWPDCFGPVEAASTSGSVPDFIVGDFNVNTPGTYPFRSELFSLDNAQGAETEWTGPAATIGVNDAATNATPGPGEVLRIYQAYLVGGWSYQIHYSQTDTRPLLVFANPGGSEYWAPRSAALLSTLGNASFTPPASSSGYYAFVIANDASESGSFSLQITTASSAGVPDAALVYATRMEAISPNPAVATPTIQFSLAAGSRVRFDLLDLSGRRVWSTADADFGAGEWRVPVNREGSDGSRLAAGMYFVSFVVDGRPTEMRRMILLE